MGAASVGLAVLLLVVAAFAIRWGTAPESEGVVADALPGTGSPDAGDSGPVVPPDAVPVSEPPPAAPAELESGLGLDRGSWRLIELGLRRRASTRVWSTGLRTLHSRGDRLVAGVSRRSWDAPSRCGVSIDAAGGGCESAS